MSTRESSGLKPGAKIEANYQGKGRWYTGVISVIRDDGTVDINYDDGEVETSVSKEMIRLFGNIANITGLPVGAKIEANYRRSGVYYPGIISRVNTNGQSFFVTYDDGETEDDVSVNMIRVMGKSNLPKLPSVKSSSFQEGTKIEGNYRGRGTFFAGVIAKVRANGTYDIDYDDGEEESDVPANMIRSLNGDQGMLNNKAFTEGATVEANYRGRGKFWPGEVKNARSNGTYDIGYEDGEFETSVTEDMMRVLVKPAPGTIQLGSKVEGNYQGSGTYFPGKISKDHGNGTFDIAYDDGEKEEKVPLSLVRLFVAPVPLPAGTLRQGVRVEADYRGRGVFFPGKVNKDNNDGTFSLMYDDGEVELKVKATSIRLPAAESTAVPPVVVAKTVAAPAATSMASGVKFAVGNKIEANFQNSGTYFPGKISKVCGNDTFDISYDDGEKEEKVPLSLVRLFVAPVPLPAGTLRQGVRVEADYRGRGVFFPGKVNKDNNDGTFSLMYDDGEIELKVKASSIRLPAGSVPVVSEASPVSSSSSGGGSGGGAKLSVGTKVEANYRKSGQWYPGVVFKVHSSGIYDIKYDDGEDEEKVDADRVRKVENAQPPVAIVAAAAPVKAASSVVSPLGNATKAAPSFSIGQKIEGNYGGGGKWYAGVIALVRNDGTSFDIAYDDGEKESNVQAALVRIPVVGFSAAEMAALRVLLARSSGGVVNNSSGNTPRLGGEDEPMSSPRGSLQKALIASKQLELDAMEHAISSLQAKNTQVSEHVRILSDELSAAKTREADLLRRIQALENR